MRRGAMFLLTSCPDPNPDEAALSLTLSHVPRRLVLVAIRCVLSGRAPGRPSKHRYRARITRISNGPSTAARKLGFAQRDHHRPSASCGQCNPAVVGHRLRPMIAARSCVSGKARTNPGRDARYVITDVTRLPQRPLPNGRDEALPRPCDGWSGWLRRRRHGQRHVAGRGGVSARGGRLRAADRVGRGPDQRAGGANVPLECLNLRIKKYFNGRAIKTGGTHFD